MMNDSKIERVAYSLKGSGKEHREESGGAGRGASVGSAGGVGVQAPIAMREPVEHVIHGDRRVDHYAWLKNRKDPRVKEYLEAENVYADAMMRSTEGFQEKLYQEMLGRIQQTDLSVPYRLRGYLYYTRTEQGKQYAIYCRRKEESAGSERRGAREEEDAIQGTSRDEHGGHGEDWEKAKIRSLTSPARAGKLRITETAKGQQTGREEADARGEEEVLLDLNELAVGHTFMGLGILEVSEDNQLLAYATDTTGYRQYTLEVKDLRTGLLLGSRLERNNERPASEGGPYNFRVERVTSAAWAADNQTLFYVTEDEVTKRSNQLWRHVLGDQRLVPSDQKGGIKPPLQEEERTERPASENDPGHKNRVSEGGPYKSRADELLYEERDERFRMDVEKSRSGAYLFLVVNSHTASEVRYLRADRPEGMFQLVAGREDEHEYYLDHHPGSAGDPAGGVFFIRTNSGGRTYRLMTASVEDPARSRWHEVVPNRPKVMLAGMEAFRTHLVLFEREDGLPYLRIVDLTREAPTALAASKRIEFSEPAYNAMMGTNPEFDAGFVRFQYESFITPRSVYDYDVRTGGRILRKQQPVLGGYDPTKYVSERLHATAKDGTEIPLSVVRRRDTLRDGNAPMLLYGYGSYGFSMPVSFSSNRLSLLDRGMVYAIAHARGGGELGKPWHDAGRMRQKMNTFTDFIASAEYLIAKRYTSAERLVIEGGSAGGLLMGAVTNMRPELFHVVVTHVPFVDVLNTMLDPSLPLTVGEYEEWGNPQIEEDYFYMKGYCPYTNLARKAYPRMLVKTALNDSQVMYWEPAKYVARLRTLKTDGNALLLKTNMGAGHGGASGRYDYLQEIAFDYAFLLGELGIVE
jgi:oligopeptidase B